MSIRGLYIKIGNAFWSRPALFGVLNTEQLLLTARLGIIDLTLPNGWIADLLHQEVDKNTYFGREHV